MGLLGEIVMCFMLRYELFQFVEGSDGRGNICSDGSFGAVFACNGCLLIDGN